MRGRCGKVSSLWETVSKGVSTVWKWKKWHYNAARKDVDLRTPQHPSNATLQIERPQSNTKWVRPYGTTASATQTQTQTQMQILNAASHFGQQHQVRQPWPWHTRQRLEGHQQRTQAGLTPRMQRWLKCHHQHAQAGLASHRSQRGGMLEVRWPHGHEAAAWTLGAQRVVQILQVDIHSTHTFGEPPQEFIHMT